MISAIIVNYKSAAKTAKCLQSFWSAIGSHRGEAIIVDNCSGDNLDHLASDNVKIIYSQKNLGMGGGNNLGVHNAVGDYVLILNPDIILTPNSVVIMLEDFNSGVGVMGPKLLNPDGSLQLSSFRFPKVFDPILRRTFLGKYFTKWRDNFSMSANHLITVDWLMGSCWLIARERYLGFDERFFMYFEDIDYCRLCQKNGLAVIYNPRAIAHHEHARESARYPWYLAPFLDRMARIHIISGIKYFRKWS